MTQVLLTILIFIAAVLYSSVGHAGASGYLAAMALCGVAPEVMKPTALTLNIFVATIGTIRFARAGCFSWRLFSPFAIASVPMAFLGGLWQLSAPAYKQLLGGALLIAAINLLFQSVKNRSAQQRASRTRLPHPMTTAICGGVIGLLAGLTGVGGGIFLSPVLLFMAWADPRRTAGVSAAFILANSISGLAGHLTSLHSLPAQTPLWVAAAVIGGLIGSGLGARKFGNQTLRAMLGVVLIIASVKLMLG